MKNLMMAVGGILVAFGLVDLLGSFADFDVWSEIGVQLPELLWQYSAYIEMIIGYLLFQVGKSGSSTASEA